MPAEQPEQQSEASDIVTETVVLSPDTASVHAEAAAVLNPAELVRLVGFDRLDEVESVARSILVTAKSLSPENAYACWALAASLNRRAELCLSGKDEPGARAMHQEALTFAQRAYNQSHKVSAQEAKRIGILLEGIGYSLGVETIGYRHAHKD